MEGFSDTYSHLELEKSRIFYASFVEIFKKNKVIFLREEGLQHTLKRNPSFEAFLPFSFYNSLFNFIFFGEQFQHTLRKKILSELPFLFFIFLRGAVRRNHTHPTKSSGQLFFFFLRRIYG